MPKISGKKCTIELINEETAKQFHNDYNIYDYKPSTIHLGAICDNILISMLSLTLEDKNALKWKITAFSSDYHYICQGTFGKLLSYFIKNYQPNEILAYSDIRYDLNDIKIYTKFGFNLKDIIKPTYDYVLKSNPTNRIDKLKISNNNDYCKIWNCGYKVYEWKKD